MEGLNKLSRIAELLDGKGIVLIRSDDAKGQWFVHCWLGSDGYRCIHKTFTNDVDTELDVVNEKLEGLRKAEDDRPCSIRESLEQSLAEMKLMREGKLPSKNWADFKKELYQESAPERYRIVGILHSKGDLAGQPRTDGRYPKRIGRICEKPTVHIGIPLIIQYIYNADGSDYAGFFLRTSRVVRHVESGNKITIETMNSIYEFEKVEE